MSGSKGDRSVTDFRGVGVNVVRGLITQVKPIER
jgi:hypothetical protein